MSNDMKTWLECVKEAATSEGWITGQDFINAQSENTLDVFSVAAKMYHEQSNSHKQVVMQGLPIEFVEWLGRNYVRMHGGWTPIYSSQIKPNLKTTMEMYEAYHALKDILNIPTIAHTGSPSVGKEGEDASVSDGK